MASRPEREKQTEWNSTGTGGWTPRPPEPPPPMAPTCTRPAGPRAPQPLLHPPGCEAVRAETGPLSRHLCVFYFSRRGGKRGAGSQASRFLWVPLAAPPPPKRPAPSPPGPGGFPRATPRVTPCPYVMGLGGEHPKVGFLPHRPRLGAWHPHRCLPPTPAAVAPAPYLGARCGGYGRSRGCATRLDHFMGRRGPAGGGARSGPPQAAPTRGPPGRDVPWDAGSSGHGLQPLGRLAAEARGPSRAAPHAAPPAVTLFASVIFSLPAAGGFGSRPALPRGAVRSTTSPGSPGTG